MSRRWFVTPVIVLVLAGLGMACAFRPRQRPLPTTRIDDSLQQVRKQLEGSWDLVSLEIHPASGQPVSVGARAVLVYDAYGNLEISGVVTDSAQAKALDSTVLTSKGRAVIDQANKRIRLTDVASEVSADKTRLYEFEGNLLRLTSVDASGRVTAVATWKKR
jgi:hypothetical protein